MATICWGLNIDAEKEIMDRLIVSLISAMNWNHREHGTSTASTNTTIEPPRYLVEYEKEMCTQYKRGAGAPKVSLCKEH